MLHLASPAPPTSGNTAASTCMDFTETNQIITVLDNLRLQKDSGRFCDMVFHVKSKEYLAHRNVLAASSPYFNSMLNANKDTREHVTVHSDRSEVFETMLNYIYTGKVFINDSNVYELLHLANHFIVAKLKEHCCEYLAKNVNVSNCFVTKDEAEKCDSVSLTKTVDYFIHSHINEILEQQEILNFSLKKLQSFVMSCFYPITEEQKLCLIGRWVKFNVPLRRNSFRYLLGLIQWTKMNTNIVYEMIEMEKWFRNEEICQFELLNLLADKNALHPSYYSQLQDLRVKMHQLGSYSTNSILEMAISVAVGQFDQEQEDDDVNGDKDNILEEENTSVHNNLKRSISKDQNISVNNGEKNTVALKSYDEDGNLGTLNIDLSSERATFQEDSLWQNVDGVTLSPKFLSQESETLNQETKKWKNMPVKIRIPKSRITNFESCKIPKRRGRPPRKTYSKQRKNLENKAVSEKKSEKIQLNVEDKSHNQLMDNGFTEIENKSCKKNSSKYTDNDSDEDYIDLPGGFDFETKKKKVPTATLR